jgi:hypothetical protein
MVFDLFVKIPKRLCGDGAVWEPGGTLNKQSVELTTHDAETTPAMLGFPD